MANPYSSNKGSLPEQGPGTKLPSPRITNFGLFALMLVGMAFALYIQHYQNFEPCPLCIFQRVALMGVGFTALVAALHNPAILGRRVYAGLTMISALIGLGVAGRHSWMQHLPPDDVPACGPGLDTGCRPSPCRKSSRKYCTAPASAPRWTGWLGLSLPEWTLAMFVGIVLVCGWQLWRKS